MISRANNPWIRTVSGKKFHLLCPRPSEIDIKDIAWSLARQSRFYGHTLGEPYYTAQHCVLGARQIEPEFAYYFLMHDSGENFAGDVNKYLKDLLPDYRRIERVIEQAIARKFKLPFPFPPEVKRMDIMMLATEQRDLRYKGDWSDLPYKPLDIKIRPWPWRKAYTEFLKEFNRLSP